MISKIIDEDIIQKIHRLLQKCNNIVLLTHEHPDGDALGSALAMYDYLRLEGKRVSVIVPDEIPSFLQWMPAADAIVVYEQDPETARSLLGQAELIMFLDLNSLNRVGTMASFISQLTVHKVLIDHHNHREKPLAHLEIRLPEMASTSEMVFRYICRVGAFEKLSKECAVCIYTGMMTDTGAFTYNSQSEEMYLIINQLLLKGINKDEIYKKVYGTSTESRMRLMGYVLYEKMEVLPEFQTAIITLSREELDRFEHQAGDTDGFVNLPLSMSNVRFSVFLREEDEIRISLRSEGELSTSTIAAELFNGGGHTNASGATYQGSLEEAKQKIKEALPKYLRPQVNEENKSEVKADDPIAKPKEKKTENSKEIDT